MVIQGATDREEQIQVAQRSLSHYLQKLSEKAQNQGTYSKIGAKAFETMCSTWNARSARSAEALSIPEVQ